MNITKTLIPLVFVSTLTASSMASAAPQGKPFVEINGQIVELQGTVQSLSEQIDNFTLGATTIEDKVALLEDAVKDLQAVMLLAASQVDLDAVAIDVAANSSLIAALQGQIDRANDFIKLKQHIVSGTCPEGEAISAIHPSGTVTCTLGDAGPGLLTRSIGYNYGSISPGTASFIIATCEDGYMAAGGGWLQWKPDGLEVLSFGTELADENGPLEAWAVDMWNPEDDSAEAVVLVNCISLQ